MGILWKARKKSTDLVTSSMKLLYCTPVNDVSFVKMKSKRLNGYGVSSI